MTEQTEDPPTGLKARFKAQAERDNNSVLQTWVGRQIIKYGIPLLGAVLAGAGTYAGRAIADFSTTLDSDTKTIIQITDRQGAQAELLLQQAAQITALNGTIAVGRTRRDDQYNSQNTHISTVETGMAVLQTQMSEVFRQLNQLFNAVFGKGQKSGELTTGPDGRG